jgi:hypothetical protein
MCSLVLACLADEAVAAPYIDHFIIVWLDLLYTSKYIACMLTRWACHYCLGGSLVYLIIFIYPRIACILRPYCLYPHIDTCNGL